LGPSILKIVRSRGQGQNLGTISESAISPGAVSFSGRAGPKWIRLLGE
jgi:hypothetical protein